ncbi:alcohol dehydrogenase [Bacillus pseudomycoides]|uniref:Alcohol dehydrogenase n=1 Tax=Bacillus pseudomycoides TaxID=64104 RepID=A0ABD6T8Y5_9BACI|nr:quinone oxidoreductase [Bacillus pseudomycoides]MBD5797494.1 alcohol dehydrogenase [Bacillus pseudomycoides]MED1477433.1 quinone oxidoreductase [Bacillus pseudomycoides]PEO88851.1 alcohol dehydrogenase [Bacillus pseudomycoides]PEP71713.1 alcohol dehydrogenase [Bacillus pseudomycoides]PGF06422.1 alcohol dehydrogenase [Bacillus pseudomycoides]
MKALCFKEFGNADVLKYQEVSDPIINPTEILVRTKAIGLNFADIYRRRGDYHLAGKPPYILGYEGSGIVEQIGAEVTDVTIGDRIAFADVPFANAELVAVPKEKAIPLPNSISFETASSVLLQGLTAHYLTQDSYKVKAGDFVLVHAAAGGVGQLLIQMIKMRDAQVIGLTSSKEKAEAAYSAGADRVFLYSESWHEEILQVTKGHGVDVVYESIGSTLEESFKATKIGGTVVFYGMAGGDPAPVDPRMLMDTSKTLTGGDLWNVLTTYEERKNRSSQLFAWITAGKLNIQTPTTFALENGAEAHRLLESRKSTGKILLIP